MNMPTSFNAAIECKTLAEAIEILGEIKRRIENPPIRLILEECQKTIHAATVRGFLDGRTPDGEPWAPVKQRAGWQRYLVTKPLIKTGLLMGNAAAATAYPAFTVSKDSGSMEVDATNPWYGGLHLAATKNRPSRVWLGVSEKQIKAMEDKADDMVMANIIAGDANAG